MNAENSTRWQYMPAQTVAPKQSPAETAEKNAIGDFSWTAAEYIEHERGASWYFFLILATAAIAAAIYLMTKDFFAVGATVVVGIVLAVFAGRKPKQVRYELSQTGLKIGEKTYNYNLFKSFSVMREGSNSSINLMPLKRLMPPIAAYFAPQDEQRIVNVIGEYLPFEERKLDATDRLAHRLRF
jgi:hypothetical protein